MKEFPWWKEAVFYQIYPRSFADSNGDGIGDLRGILQKLDLLQDLGIDAVWLSPHYPSPLWDCGYDIADYTAVAPEYGTMDDFKELLDGLHQRQIRLVLDLVLNHTSDQHPWFIESGSSRDNPKRDWYVWRDGKDGKAPNNWYSTFGGSAWEIDPRTGQYYYHFFFKEQPDLNWRNPEVKQAMFNVARYWLDLGVDGFRLDAIGTLFEDEALTDQRSDFTQTDLYRMSRLAKKATERKIVEEGWNQLFHYQHDLPEIHAVMRELRGVIDEYPDRVLIGETDLIEYYGNGDDELHMVFNFPLKDTDKLTPTWIRANQELRIQKEPARTWDANTLGNHDSPRIKSHYGDGIHDEALARVCLALMLTLRGTPFLYNGEEIGMTDLMLGDIRDFRDQMGIWTYQTELEVLKSSPEAALAYAAAMTRDKGRTPLQWDRTENAGFCPAGVRSWLPVNPDYREGINYAVQQNDPDSLFNFYRKMLRMRRQNPALRKGEYLALDRDAKGYVAFVRSFQPDGQTCLVVLNFSDQAYTLNYGSLGLQVKTIFSTHIRNKEIEHLERIEVAPFEVYIGAIGEN